MGPLRWERSLEKRLVEKPTNPDGLVLEAWAQGFMVGALIIMSCITAANMRAGVLLHKIILIELLFGIWHGFFIFNHPPVYGWYLSVSAIFLNTSWSLHNVIAWMKIKPFLSRKGSRIFILSVAVVQPYWVIEIYANFTYFNNINSLFVHTRPFEALFRDPWWIFTVIALFYNIKTRYDMSVKDIIRISPRFAIMLMAMILSICFLITDICSVTGVFDSGALPVGINPFWKLSFVFKCLTDSVILDDFKTALDRLRAFKISRLGSFAIEGSATERSWRKGLSQQHHPWAMDEVDPTEKKTSETKSIFQPLTIAKITTRPQQDEISPTQTRSNIPIGQDLKATTDHIEQATKELTTDREEEVATNAGITRHKGLREPERSWLRDAGGVLRSKQRPNEHERDSLEEIDYAPDSIDNSNPKDLEVGRAI